MIDLVNPGQLPAEEVMFGTPSARMWKGSGPVGSKSHQWLMDHGNVEAQVLMLPTPVAQPSGNTPEDHLAKKPGRKQVTDLAVLMENGLLETGGRLPRPATEPVQEAFLEVIHARQAELMPTPTAQDKNGMRTTYAGGGLTLQGVVGGVLPSDTLRMERRGYELKVWKALEGVGEPEIQWGDYEPAIRRWEAIMGRPAPAPTEPNAKGYHRLSARFTEWLMGQPEGWITDPSIGISRNDQLKACGNGVVTQQAVAALQDMLEAFEEAA
jgi:DNA (cytosine-5)-methyltransferase 1